MATAKQTASSGNSPASGSNPLVPENAPANPVSQVNTGQLDLPTESQADISQIKEQEIELARLRNQVAEMELRNQQLEAEKKSLGESMLLERSENDRRKSFVQSTSATRNKPTFKFRVAVANDPALPTLEIVAVDESEAIRQYVLKATPGKVLDTTNLSWRVECMETPRRLATWREVKAARLVERGHAAPTMAMMP